jgi:hypothetical protein
MNQQYPPMMRFHQVELTILIRSPKEEELRQRGNLVQDLARKRNPIKEPSHRGFDGRYEIMSRCIGSGSTVVISYGQSNNSTSEQEFLITTAIQS